MNDSPPRVTVVVPTFNCAGLIAACLDSLEAQDYPNLEVLVMDGASKDATVEIAQGYAPLVEVRSEPDAGIYDAMNKGIAAATGEWIFFLGADDGFAAPDVVSRMMASGAARDESALLLYGSVDSPSLGPRFRGEIRPTDIFELNVCHQAVFYRRRLFDLEGVYDLRYRTYADWAINLRAFLDHPEACRFVDLIVADYTGGASAIGWDKEFFVELPRLFAEYVARKGGFAGSEAVQARLYLQALRAARMKGDGAASKRLVGEVLRRPALIPRVGGLAFGQLRAIAARRSGG